MNKLRTSKIALLKTVFVHGVRSGKLEYISYLLIGSIISFEMFFWIKLPQLSTDAIYRLYTIDGLKFYDEIRSVLVLLGVLLLFLIAKFFYKVIGVKVRRNTQTYFELSLIKSTSFLPWEDYENHEFKSKLDLVNQRGQTAFQNIAIDLIEFIISTLIYVFVYVAIIIQIDLYIGLIFLSMTIAYFFIGYYFGYKNYQIINRRRGQGYKIWYLFRLGENKEIHQDLLVNRGTRYATNLWLKEYKEFRNETIKSQTLVSIFLFIPNILFGLMAGWLMYSVIGLVTTGEETIGFFSLVISTIISYKMTLQFFAIRSQWYTRNFEIYQDYQDVMGRPHELDNNNITLDDQFTIRFDNVKYSYIQSDFKALNGLDLTINHGETLAIVGKNGSGKTTFVNLMAELTKRYDGRIMINDRNIDESLGTLRNSVAVILQDFQEYQVTIRENIQLGDINRELSTDEINDIIDQVGLRELVDNLPEGIDTMLGQINDGTELSKGQWQRLAVARLLAKKDAKIWILDEPTAYLDPLAEIKMYDFIYSLKGNRAVIFISHRLGFAKKADRIVVFKDGQVIEQGNHKELIKNNNEYAKMFDKQKGWYQ